MVLGFTAVLNSSYLGLINNLAHLKLTIKIILMITIIKTVLFNNNNNNNNDKT